jgi:hypothetical protein
VEQIVIPSAGGDFQFGDLKPLRGGQPNGDGGLRVPVFLDLALKLCERDFGCAPACGGLN